MLCRTGIKSFYESGPLHPLSMGPGCSLPSFDDASGEAVGDFLYIPKLGKNVTIPFPSLLSGTSPPLCLPHRCHCLWPPQGWRVMESSELLCRELDSAGKSSSGGKVSPLSNPQGCSLPSWVQAWGKGTCPLLPPQLSLAKSGSMCNPVGAGQEQFWSPLFSPLSAGDSKGQ